MTTIVERKPQIYEWPIDLQQFRRVAVPAASSLRPGAWTMIFPLHLRKRKKGASACQRVRKRSKCETKFNRGDSVVFVSACRRCRAQLLRRRHSCVKRTTGDRLMWRTLMIVRRRGRTFVMAAVHIRNQA